MGKNKRMMRDGTGSYSGISKKGNGICPFDKESKEDIGDMEFEFEGHRRMRMFNDKLGKGRFIK